MWHFSISRCILYTVIDRLSAQGSAKRPALWQIFFIGIQVRSCTQLKLCANLNKRKRRIFAINLGRELLRNFEKLK